MAWQVCDFNIRSADEFQAPITKNRVKRTHTEGAAELHFMMFVTVLVPAIIAFGYSNGHLFQGKAKSSD